MAQATPEFYGFSPMYSSRDGLCCVDRPTGLLEPKFSAIGADDA